MKTSLLNIPEKEKASSARNGAETVGLWVVLALVFLLLARSSQAQDIEPRRWSHLPIGANYAGAAYAYTTGDISLDPTLRIENGEFDLHTIGIKYIRSFQLLGKSARVDLLQPYQIGKWTGVLNGTPAQGYDAADWRTLRCVSR